MKPSQKDIILEAIEEYNKYRTPEVTARLIFIFGGTFKIEFTGFFCYTCGFYDYFEDYRVLLEERGLMTRIVKIEELDEGALVTFQIADEKGLGEISV